MIFFDTTKTGAAGHRSGLTRVSARLRGELGSRASAVAWDDTARRARRGDWFLTTELFSEEERPGFSTFLSARPCRLAAVFHDAIPLKLPHITWPQSVGRHPSYMKLLAQFDRVWAVSAASRDELVGYWRWAGAEHPPPVEVLALGADFNRQPRVTSRHTTTSRPQLLCIGILEPRKNQLFLLDVCESLWAGGLDFELHVVGRINPHFGAPIKARITALQRTRREQLHFHQAADDAVVTTLYAAARATVFPTLAEGCGLPLLESLWQGVPCVCSDLPVLRENAAGGGCFSAPTSDPKAWRAALHRIVTEQPLVERLGLEATSRQLPTWREAADTLARSLT